MGSGTLVGPGRVVVDDIEHRANNVVLATGSAPLLLPETPAGDRILTSTTALELEVIPTNVVIIGGSVIGVEFASAWQSLGAKVTIIESLPTLLPQEDPSLSKQLVRRA